MNSAPYYGIPTDNCNLEINGYPFFAESVTANEPFRRREYTFNNLVGGTQDVRKGAYVGLDFSITTHVKVNPNRPDMHNNIFTELMSKPVRVVSPELGGEFNAIVKIKPEHETPSYLKLTIDIKEVPDRDSHIPGETFKVPAAHTITVQKKSTKSNCKKVKVPAGFTSSGKLSKKTVTVDMCEIQDGIIASVSKKSKNKSKSKKASVSKKSKSKKNRK